MERRQAGLLFGELPGPGDLQQQGFAFKPDGTWRPEPFSPGRRPMAMSSLPRGDVPVQEQQGFHFKPDGAWRPGGCECGGGCGCTNEHRVTASPAGADAAASSTPASSDGSQGPTTGAGDGWSGYSPGVAVEPGKDDKGNPDPCKSIITLHVWLDAAASNAKGCPQNYLGIKPNMSDIDLERELADARRILEGKRFACPCKKPPGKKCWLEFRIKVHSSQGGDDPGGPTPVPVEFDCRCKKTDVDPGTGIQPAYDPPGDYTHGPHRFHVCWPPLPTAPHNMAHEVLHALGLGPGTDKYTGRGTPLPGWEKTLMGDAHGTGVTQRDICAIAKANKACRVPGERGKKDTVCCDAYDDTVIGADGKAIPADSVPIAQALTTGPRRSVVFVGTQDLAGVLHSAAAQVLGAGAARDASLWE